MTLYLSYTIEGKNKKGSEWVRASFTDVPRAVRRMANLAAGIRVKKEIVSKEPPKLRITTIIGGSAAVALAMTKNKNLELVQAQTTQNVLDELKKDGLSFRDVLLVYEYK